MRYKDNVEWLKSLKQQIGQTQHRDLWHFEQVIDETIENLKPLAKPHGRLIDADKLYEPMERNLYAGIGCDPTNIAAVTIYEAPTIIEAEENDEK